MQRRSLKDRILDHAMLRLLDQGYRGMRVDELARDVGISKRTLYELFRTKEDIAKEALLCILADLVVKLDRAVIDNPDHHGEQLRVMIRLIGDSFISARLPFYRDLETTPALVELVERTREQVVDRLDRVLLSGASAGHFRSDFDPKSVLLVLMASLDFLQRQGSDRKAMESACAGLYDLLARGLLVPR